jgi:hypothetical protein
MGMTNDDPLYVNGFQYAQLRGDGEQLAHLFGVYYAAHPAATVLPTAHHYREWMRSRGQT